MTTPSAVPERAAARVSRRGRLIFALAAVVVLVAAVVGVLGLLASPIESVGAGGVTTLRGTWEPYSCNARLCEGYVQAGARSVFVVLANGCPVPGRAAMVTVRGRPDPGLGPGSYRAVDCTS